MKYFRQIMPQKAVIFIERIKNGEIRHQFQRKKSYS